MPLNVSRGPGASSMRPSFRTKSPRGWCAGLSTSTRCASADNRSNAAARAASCSNGKSVWISPFTTMNGPAPSSGSASAMPPAVSSGSASCEYAIRAPYAPPSPSADSMRRPRCETLTTISLNPPRTSRSSNHTINGFPATGMRGLGMRSVSGRMRSRRPALDAIEQRVQRQKLRIALTYRARVAQKARGVLEISRLAVAIANPREDAQYLEMALQSHPFEVAVKVSEVASDRQTRAARLLPIAHSPVEHLRLVPAHERIPEERDEVIRDGPENRILKIQYT